ncbi:Methionine import ATP-binding protein MetN [termite gut metagenome]|uniref:Methionine import ATP-binding protein MetN n=1 Tax=termite gut metagenome TaxID=433724 RepID=A0A5J4T2G4_9ZZZZ
MIELRNVTKEFRHKGKITTALSNVSITVPKGKIVGVIGESGAGKSTLVRCANLLERPTKGEVIINGECLTQMSPSELTKVRRNIGMIFQHFNLLSSRTVFDNVAFPLELNKTLKKDITQRVLELLKIVGLENKAYDYPSKLSGGQKQRVAIARALANNPAVLLCDEATSALDPATTDSILSLLKEINIKLNITILLITHEPDVVKKICDEVVVLSEGKLIEKGSVAKVFSCPENELTHYFVSSSIHIQVPIEYKEKLTNAPCAGKHLLITVKISGQFEIHTILSDIRETYKTESNIVCMQMDYINGLKIGAMLVELRGEAGDEQLVVEFLKNNNMEVEIAGYV